MTPRLLTILVLSPVVVAGVSPAAPVAPPPREVVYYFPTAVGTKWTYQGSGAPFTWVVTRVEKKGRAHVVSVGEIGKDDRVAAHDKYEVSEKGLFHLEKPVYQLLNGPDGRPKAVVTEWRTLTPPVCKLKLPLVSGEKWEGRPNPGDPATYTAGRPAKVKVPAGQFEAIPVEVTYPTGGDTTHRGQSWYAPGVGPVKWSTNAVGDVVLTGFWPGKE